MGVVMTGGEAGARWHGTQYRHDAGLQHADAVGYEVRQGRDFHGRGGKGGWDESAISPQRQEGCTTKAVDTGTEKGH